MAGKRDYSLYSDDRVEPSSQASEAAEMENIPSSPPGLPEFGDLEDEREEIDDVGLADSDGDGEDLQETAITDYAPNAAQDAYNLDADEIDEQEYEEMDFAERRKVDEMLRARAEGRELPDMGGRRSTFLQDDDVDAMQDEENLPFNRRLRHQFDEAELSDSGNEYDEEEEGRYLTLAELSAVKAPTILEWITQPAVHRTIAREFKNFLLEYTDSKGRSVYGSRILTLGEANAESLEVHYQHLVDSRAVLAYFVVVCPVEILKIMDVTAMEVIELRFPNFARIHPEVHVRITDLPLSYTLRELREHHLNTLIRVTGVVTRRTGVFPQLKWIKFDCLKCGAVLGPYIQESHQEVKLNYCSSCQNRGPFAVNRQETIYRNYQRMTLQESPGTVPAGRLPRHRDVILLADLIDSAKPGDEVDVVGVYRNAYDNSLNVKTGFPVFSTVLEANTVVRRDAGLLSEVRLSELEEREMRNIAKDPNIIDEIVKAMCPSIFGHEDIKIALAAALFGGVPKETGKITVRGDINVLLLGDPGTAKSQLLKYCEKTASRAVFATGQGASAVGLTASVRKDAITREWTLEGGALVLADKGMCLIDEFDKMNDQDRTSIHEAMEQQSISVSKAGIVANLQARCSVVAAANPRYGRYNASETLMANVDLTEPILSRFDVVCVVQDLVNEEKDRNLAKWVVKNHARSSAAQAGKEIPEETRPQPKISQEMLRKYIHYARSHCNPRLMQVHDERISGLYTQLRQESKKSGSFPVTVRHLESIVRLSESFARMRLSDYVLASDVDRAIKITVNSFVQSQKMNQRRALRQSLLRYLF